MDAAGGCSCAERSSEPIAAIGNSGLRDLACVSRRGICPILLVYPIWAVVSLKLPAISLPIFSGKEICLQIVRDISGACAILESLQYPSFARANTVSESHYARTMSMA